MASPRCCQTDSLRAARACRPLGGPCALAASAMVWRAGSAASVAAHGLEMNSVSTARSAMKYGLTYHHRSSWYSLSQPISTARRHGMIATCRQRAQAPRGTQTRRPSRVRCFPPSVNIYALGSPHRCSQRSIAATADSAYHVSGAQWSADGGDAGMDGLCTAMYPLPRSQNTALGAIATPAPPNSTPWLMDSAPSAPTRYLERGGARRRRAGHQRPSLAMSPRTLSLLHSVSEGSRQRRTVRTHLCTSLCPLS